MRYLTSIIIALFLFSTFYGNVYALNSIGEKPIHLKIDKYYILYSIPSAPFIDKKNRLLIPLRLVEDLMGGSVDTKTNTASLDHKFQFTVGSTTAIVDDTVVKMDTMPVLKDGVIFIPLRLFLDHTDLKWEWSTKYKYLHLKDKRIVKGKPFEQFAGNDFTVTVSDNAFHLKSFMVKEEVLTIKALNISGKDIESGKADIQPLVSYRRGGHSVDSYTRSNYPPLPAVEKDDEVIKRSTMYVSDASYIISVGRELK
ncbi:copper amine oxidase N-terminal domain-containing protein [Paenibacillus alkalitolerans]|uniref:copper amine oxidase N-terminal domain-containing protein n=1 Tax=Paenibacillus alkalitolerans TaxID=2799335 RepID=UPI0018F67410|nr:copper amine oxidase N-terminal domain-containing protein [Paenibacillus alkalitolerans]